MIFDVSLIYHWFKRKKSTILVSDVDYGGTFTYVRAESTQEIYLPLNFIADLELLLKNKV